MTSSLRTFEECIEKVSYGAKIQRKDYLNKGKYPVVSQESALINGFWDGDSDVFIIDRPVIVFGDHTRTLKYIDFSFVLGADGAKIIKPKNFLNSKFFYYFLMANPIEGKGYARHYRFLKELTLNVPPLDTQRKIVAKIDAIFAEIDKATAAAEANARNAEVLFQSYMSKTFAECESLHSRSQLISICDLQNGYAFKSADYIEYSETLNIRMSGIRPGGFFDAEHNKRYLPDSYAEKYKEFLLKEGDLVIAMTDMAGDPKILGVPTIVKDLNDRRFLMNQRVGKLHKFSDSIHIPYLRYFLTSPKIKEFYKNKGDGGLQINISKKDILSAEIPLPPLSIQEKIGKEMSYVQSHSEILKNRYFMKINEYIALKQSILRQTFAGELVKE